MNFCPTCQKPFMPGELFCLECGSPLLYSSTSTAPVLPQTHRGTHAEPDKPPQLQRDRRISSVKMLFLDSQSTIELSGREAFTLGREAEGQSLHPDIDLSPYQGYESGVSRLHATIRIDRQVTATDLGSSNGTRLNGVKMNPNETYPLRDGDILTVGKLKIRVGIHYVSEG